jgi:hypothetical protein
MTEFETVCSKNRDRIRLLPLDQQYQQRIEYRGTVYYYDPDFDCFYPHQDPADMSLWDRWGWIVVIIALSILAVITA